jgi:hypothetical protein
VGPDIKCIACKDTPLLCHHLPPAATCADLKQVPAEHCMVLALAHLHVHAYIRGRLAAVAAVLLCSGADIEATESSRHEQQSQRPHRHRAVAVLRDVGSGQTGCGLCILIWVCVRARGGSQIYLLHNVLKFVLHYSPSPAVGVGCCLPLEYTDE